jgi:hypothetical protein
MNESIKKIIKIILLIFILILLYNFTNSIDPNVQKEQFTCDLDKLNIDDLVILNRNPEYINYINKLIDDKSFMFTDEQLKVLKNPNQFYNVNQSNGSGSADTKNISFKIYNTCKDQIDTVVNTVDGNFSNNIYDSLNDDNSTDSASLEQQLDIESTNEYNNIIKNFETNIKNTIKPDCVNSCVMSDPKYLKNYYLDLYGNQVQSTLTDYFADYYTNINIKDPKQAIPVDTLKGNSNFIIPDQYYIQNKFTNAYNVDWSRIVDPYTIY